MKNEYFVILIWLSHFVSIYFYWKIALRFGRTAYISLIPLFFPIFGHWLYWRILATTEIENFEINKIDK